MQIPLENYLNIKMQNTFYVLILRMLNNYILKI